MSTASPAPTPPAGGPDEVGASQPAAPRSSYSMGSFSNMARSLLVILGMVAVLVAIVPRIQGVQQPAVDAASVASDAVRQTGLPFELPVGLPAGWSPTNARYAASTDGLPTWQAGWSTPHKGYVAIRQTATASPAWLQEATGGGHQTGTVEVGGRTWTRYDDASHRRTSLVNVPSGADAASTTTVATVVTGIADGNNGGDTADDLMGEITTFTTALQPAPSR